MSNNQIEITPPLNPDDDKWQELRIKHKTLEYNREYLQELSMKVKTPQEIYDHLNTIVVGQDEAKKTLSTIGYMYYQQIIGDNKNLLIGGDKKILPRLTPLITGPTGCGKTLLLQTLGKYLDLPIYSIEAGAIDAPHRDNRDIYHHIYQAVKSFPLNPINNDITPYGIIIIDEIDKLFRVSTPNDHNTRYYHSVTDSLLALLDGSGEITCKSLKVDTSKLLIILCGAFEYANKTKENTSGPIGFKVNVKDKKFVHNKKDIIENTCITPEILGRINVVTHVNRLTKEEIMSVLTDVKGAILPQYTNLFNQCYEPLYWGMDDIKYLVDKIYDSEFGMREAKTVVYEYLKEKLFKLK